MATPSNGRARRCERQPNEGEALLSALAGELQRAVKAIKTSLLDGMVVVRVVVSDALEEARFGKDAK
jgi:hypothetical protein